MKGLKPGLHADGGGLYLRIEATGARRWTFIFRFQGRRCEMGLGPAADISLATAREAARQARLLVRAGVSPVEDRRRQEASVAAVTFGQFADELIENLSPQWKSAIHRRQWKTTLSVDAAALRPKLLPHITTEDVLGVLKPIWQTKPETAARLQGRIERVLDAAKAQGLRTGENPSRWKGHLALILPRRKKSSRGHHAALPYKDVRTFFADLRRSTSISAQALEFTILTAARTSEVLLATCAEIDLDAGVWTVPAERMKMGVEHRVALSARAIDLARGRIETAGKGYLFPGQRAGKPLSNMAMAKVMKLLGYGAYTVHGFRSTFRDWVGDRTAFPSDLAKAAIAHQVGDESEQAYRRGDALERRRVMMEAWARACEPAPADNVVAMIA